MEAAVSFPFPVASQAPLRVRHELGHDPLAEEPLPGEPTKNIWGRRRARLMANGDLPAREKDFEPVACAVCSQPTTGKYGVCFTTPACQAEYQRRAKKPPATAKRSEAGKAESRKSKPDAAAARGPSLRPDSPRAAPDTFYAEARPSAPAESDTGRGRTDARRPARAPAATPNHQPPHKETRMGWTPERREKFRATMAAKRAGKPKAENRKPKHRRDAGATPMPVPQGGGLPRIVGRIGDCLVAEDGVYRRVEDAEVQELYDALSRLIER